MSQNTNTTPNRDPKLAQASDPKQPDTAKPASDSKPEQQAANKTV